MRIKEPASRIYSDDVILIMSTYNIDSSAVEEILYKGDIDFSKSKVRQKPCRYYWIDGFIHKKETSIYVQNCDSVVTIQKLNYR